MSLPVPRRPELLVGTTMGACNGWSRSVPRPARRAPIPPTGDMRCSRRSRGTACRWCSCGDTRRRARADPGAVDGSEAEPCSLGGAATCPYSRSPAESLDGRWAMVCIDDDGDTLGLYVVETDGTLHASCGRTNPAGPGPAPRPGPTTATWSSMVGEGESTRLWQMPGDGSNEAQSAGRRRRVGGQPGLVGRGLLYLASDRAASRATCTSGRTTAGTRSRHGATSSRRPGRRTATRSRTSGPGDGTRSLWVKDAEPGAPARSPSTVGPPAWGAR